MTSFADTQKENTRWLIAIAIAFLAMIGTCATVEYRQRALGNTPTVRDDLDLWALERARLRAANTNGIAILGTSRILYGLDIDTLAARFPDKTPVMLAVNGAYPLAAFTDLAQNDSFRGMVVVEVDARGLSRYYRDMQQAQVAHFRAGVGPSASIHRRLLSLWQMHAVIADPSFGVIESIKRSFFRAPAPNPRHATLLPNRSAYLDFHHPQINVAAMAENFAAGVNADYLAHPPPDPSQWLADLSDVAENIRVIRARGGKVLFFCAPTSGAHLAADLAGYPRAFYWNRFAEEIAQPNGAATLYALDDPEFQKLPLPDGSHVDRADRAAFANALAVKLAEIIQ